MLFPLNNIILLSFFNSHTHQIGFDSGSERLNIEICCSKSQINITPSPSHDNKFPFSRKYKIVVEWAFNFIVVFSNKFSIINVPEHVPKNNLFGEGKKFTE